VADDSGPATWHIAISEQDRDTVLVRCDGLKGTVEVLTNILVENEDVILWNFHVEGPGPGTIGIRDLRELARAFGRMLGVRRVIIRGFERSTGANPGRVPHQIVIEVA
jgi:hypothetical protein